MRRVSPLIFSALLATAAPAAWAGEQAAPVAPTDPRIKLVDYDPLGVIKVVGVFRTATQIILGDDETILHVAVGDATSWEVAAEKNILFVKPKAERGPTNLIITTSRPGGNRNYTFELSTRSGAAAKAAGAIFVLRFRYPSDARETAVATASAEATALERRLLELKLDRAVVEGRRNLAYALQGSLSLSPSEVTDNGRFTVLRFPANQPLPAFYQVDDKGTEALVPFDVRGEFVVVHAVVRQLRLRRGKDVVCIYNEAFDPFGVNAATGTAAEDVERTDRGALPYD